MDQPNIQKPYTVIPLRILIIMSIFMVITSVAIFSCKEGSNTDALVIKNDSIASQKAFMGVYSVLMDARCMNCHPAGDVPLQGDDSHLHTMGVKRGVDGKGIYALKCANCHQEANLPGLHMPPGNPKWHLPPENMKMVFQGRTPFQLAKQMIDPKQNGGKSQQQLIDHVTSDSLVLGGWNAGDGRRPPPMSHEAFAKLFKEWIVTGAFAPKQ